MKKLRIVTNLVAGIDEKVVVHNYRNHTWENGTVRDIVIKLSKSNIRQFPNHHDGHPQYWVLLDRRSAKNNYIHVTVGPDGITKLK